MYKLLSAPSNCSSNSSSKELYINKDNNFLDEEFSYDSKRLQYTEKDDINNPYGLEIEKLKR